MQSFIRQNKLFFIKKFIFCFFFICSFQNSSAMQKEESVAQKQLIDLTKYKNTNLADPRIESQFLKDLLATHNNLSGSEKAIMQKLHDRFQSILNKKKEEKELTDKEKELNEGDLRETQNAINIAIKRKLISSDINEIYKKILNFKKEDFDPFADIVLPDESKYEQEIPAQASDFSYQSFKEIFQKIEKKHNEYLNSNLGKIKHILEYKTYLNSTKDLLGEIFEQEQEKAQTADEIHIITMEYRKILNDIEQKQKLFNQDCVKTINIAAITTTLALTIGCVAYYLHNKNKECKQDLELILNKLKNKLSQEKIDQLVKKRSAFFQKYLPIWTKRIFGMQCDWKKYLNKISKLPVAGI